MLMGHLKNNGKGKSIITVILIVLIITGVYFILNGSKITLEGKGVKVSGVYGYEIVYEDISELSLKESLPDGFIRVNGIDFFNSYLGNFKAENMDKIKVLLASKNEPYIFIKTKNNEYFIMNAKSKSETEEIYNSINKVINIK